MQDHGEIYMLAHWHACPCWGAHCQFIITIWILFCGPISTPPHNGLLKWVTGLRSAPASPWQQSKWLASWRRSISRSCVYPPRLCVCVHVCIQFNTEAHCLVFTAAQHIWPFLLNAALPTHSPAVKKRRRGICVVYSLYCPASGSHVTTRWPTEASRSH